MKYKALLLDFDNTIVGTEHSNFIIFKESMSDLIGRELTREDAKNFADCTWICIFERLSSIYLPHMAPVEIRKVFIDAKTNYFKEQTAEIAEGLDKLLDLDMKKAIVTGSSRAEVDMFSDYIDLSRFDLIATDDLYENGKPAPDAYLYATSQLGLAGNSCIAVEDSEIGLKSARSAGVATVFTREFAKNDYSHLADYIVDNLSSVIPLLDEDK